MTSFDFFISERTEELWQQISSHWTHRDRPAGSRFLGSVRLPKKDTERIRNSLGSNLRRLGSNNLTYDFLRERFNKSHQNWLKLLTFAASEYAYYDSSPDEKFWQGFCRILKLPHSQKVENTFRQIIDKGIDNLGLVRATGGHKYVSSLWLQSGIPTQNLDRFAWLVQEVSDEYGWWELAHTSCEELSRELLDFCQKKHPQWGTLINFLKSSCSQKEGDEVEPISGQLIQGIATVAQKLESQELSLEILKDENRREQLLKNYCLPQNFFLRNWDSLIRVLAPKERPNRSSCRIVSRCQKPLSLVFDVADSLNIQLVLPEQSLWKKEWERLGGTFCQIPEASWEDIIPSSGGLMIPKQLVDVRRVSELRTWHLLDRRRNCLIEWKIEGLASNFPCLIFDASSGERLTIDPANPTIKGTEEIICFKPRSVQLDFAEGIEFVDCIPSLIEGWQGQQLVLTSKESTIKFLSSETTTPQLINWRLSPDEQPSLRGLKLKGKKYTYLEIPTFWYPPLDHKISLNISVESLTHQVTIANTPEILSPSNSWQAIPLDRWITEPGEYEARFWNQAHRWSYRFEIKLDYQLKSKPYLDELKINSYLQEQIESLPIKYNEPHKFWREKVQIAGLWPLEVLTFSLSDKQDEVFYLGQADSSGNLRMNLEVFHDLLPDSDWYALDYQRLSLEAQRLIVMDASKFSISWTWTNQAIHLSGLSSDQLYSLSCWNLLLPQSLPVKIEVPLISPDEQAITVPLELPPGIYHVQLISSRKLSLNLGWWCGSHQYDLPDEVKDNEALANYCYTILGNEAVKDFLDAANEFDYNYQWIQTVIESMRLPYHFPEWLNSDSIREKLQALLHELNNKIQIPISALQENAPSKLANKQLSKEQLNAIWILVTLTNPKKKRLICKQIKADDRLGELILRIEMCKQAVYEDLLLVEVKDFQAAYAYLQEQKPKIDYIQKIERIKPEDANRMLGF